MRTRSDHQANMPMWEGATEPISLPGQPPAQRFPASAPPVPARRVRLGVLTGVSLWRLAIVICALYGFSDATGWTRNMEGLSQQASLLTGIVYIGLMAYPACTGGTRHEPGSPWLHGATTVLLLLVAGTFFGIMGGDLDYLPFEHVYTPLLVLVDWLAVGRNQSAVRWWYPLTWIAFPLAYLAYFLSAGIYKSLYDFLDPGNDGFAGMIAGLLVGVIAVGYVLYGFGKLKGALGGGNPLPGPPGRHGQPAAIGGTARPAVPTGPGRPGAPAAPPPPPPGGGKPGGSRRVVIVATVAALVVGGAVGGWWLWPSSSGGQSTARAALEWASAAEAGTARELWRTPQGVAPKGQKVGDHWTTGTHLVRRLPGRVAAYDLNTGTVAWELPLPGDAADNCPSSQQQSGNRVALLRKTGGAENNCGTVTVLDIATGKEVFTTKIPPIERKEVTTTDVPVVIGGHVLVGSRSGGHLLNIDTGRHVPVADDGRCREDAYAVVDGLLLARVSCRETLGSDVVLNGLRAYNTDLGELWKWQAPQEPGKAPPVIRNVLSVKPLVVELFRASTETYEMLRVDRETGKSVTLLTREPRKRNGSDYLAPCDERGIAHCQQVIPEGAGPVNPPFLFLILLLGPFRFRVSASR